jgi:DNA primase
MRELVQRTAKADYVRERRRELRRDLNPATQIVQPQERALRYENVRSARAEGGLIRLLLMDDSIFPEPFPLSPDDFSSPVLRKAFFALWERKRRGDPIAFHVLSEALAPEEASLVTGIYQAPESSENAARALSDYITVVREESEKRRGADAQEDALTKLTKKYQKQKTKGGTRT